MIDGVSWCAPCNKKYPVKDNGGGGGEDDDKDGEDDDEEEEEEEAADELPAYYELVRDGTQVDGPDGIRMFSAYYELDDTLYAVVDEVVVAYEDPVIIPGQELVAQYGRGRHERGGYRDAVSARWVRAARGQRQPQHSHVISANLEDASTVAGGSGSAYGIMMHQETHICQDGVAAQARFCYPMGLAVLPDGHVLVADSSNNCIRMLSGR